MAKVYNATITRVITLTDNNNNDDHDDDKDNDGENNDDTTIIITKMEGSRKEQFKIIRPSNCTMS